MIAPARRAAFEVVRRVFEEDAYADRALASAVEGLDERDRALAQRLAYGTVQRTRTIDFGIEQAGKRPVRKLDPPVRAALRVGAYQLAWTDQAVHAVVDDAVELVRAAKRERAVPFTNAVMRRLAQSFNGLVASLPEGPVKHSYPDWIFDVWRRDFGLDDALSLMRAQNEPPAARGARRRAGRRADRRSRRVRRRTCRHRRNAPDEPRVAARGARRRLAARRARARRLRGAGRQVADPAGRGDGGRAAPRPRRGDGEADAAERPRGHRRPARARRVGLRPRARRRAVLGARRARAPSRPALAREPAARPAARAAARRGRAHEAGRHGRLLGLHAERRRERGRRRRRRARDRAARRRVAAVRASVAAGVPADAPRPRSHERLLHRPPACRLS